MPEGMCKILVVMRAGDTANNLCTFLRSLGCKVTDVCHSGGAALRSSAYHSYDILLCSDNLPDMTGLTAAANILKRKNISVILITTEREKASIEVKYADYDITCLIKPASKMTLLHALEITCSSKRKYDKSKKTETLQQKSNEYKTLLAKAKQILMKRYNIDEPEAYRSLQKTSMDTGIPLKEIAKNVIRTNGAEFYRY